MNIAIEESGSDPFKKSAILSQRDINVNGNSSHAEIRNFPAMTSQRHICLARFSSLSKLDSKCFFTGLSACQDAARRGAKKRTSFFEKNRIEDSYVKAAFRSKREAAVLNDLNESIL